MEYSEWSIADLTLSQLADRQLHLERMRHNTQRRIKELVREKYAEGATISALAKEANISRVTVYAWLNQPS